MELFHVPDARKAESMSRRLNESVGRKTVFVALCAAVEHVVTNGPMKAVSQQFDMKGGMACAKESDLLWQR